jgi:hypothetical protein
MSAWLTKISIDRLKTILQLPLKVCSYLNQYQPTTMQWSVLTFVALFGLSQGFKYLTLGAEELDTTEVRALP